MNGLERFLRIDPDDAGCGETLRLLHVYAEELLAGREAARIHPDIAAHLRACDPCAQDLEALLIAVGVR
jgi:hypothetical protein